MTAGTFDYIVVGAGSAGCVLAARLTESPEVSVLVLEAGGSDKAMNVTVPAAFAKLFKTERDWDYSTDPEPHVDGRSLYMPRGKMLGGSSSINAMIYIRGHREDYDGWSRNGATGWSYGDVLPYFLKSENNERGRTEYHAVGGPLEVADPRSPNQLTERWVNGGVEVGLTTNADFNGAQQDGVGIYQLTQKRGRRWSAADAFLKPVMKRPNLTVRTGARVHRVVTENGRAAGVEFRDATGLRFVRADREVVLSGGAINSPQLLMLSGIGPVEHLREMGITPVVDNENVGSHLQDHPVALMAWASTAKGSLFEAEKPASLARYLTARRGLLTSNVGEGGAFIRTRADLPAPDIQFHFAPGYFQNHGFDTHDGPAISIGPTLVAPQSRGRVRLRSADPDAAPSIVGDFLADREDVDALVAGIEMAREIAASSSFRDILTRELRPGPDVKTRAEIEASLRSSMELLYHPTCTARMGEPGAAVVDPELRVYGIDGLRVVDASVMPTVVRGNTNAPTIMIAEKAADLIRSA